MSIDIAWFPDYGHLIAGIFFPHVQFLEELALLKMTFREAVASKNQQFRFINIFPFFQTLLIFTI